MEIRKRSRLFALTILSSATLSAYAGTPEKHIVVTPDCLLKNSSVTQQTLAKSGKLSLIRTDEKGVNQLITLKNKRRGSCGGFMDVTAAWNTSAKAGLSADNHAKRFLKSYEMNATPGLKPGSYQVKYTTTVNQLLSTLNPQAMWDNLTKLTSFENRYSHDENGLDAAKWIKANFEEMAKAAGRDDVKVYFVSTGSSYKQPSVVAKFGDSNKAGVIIGGHMDTLGGFWGSRMPGADDDGSGSVTVMETARVLLNSGQHFKKPIYFVWYSAEEMGLVGSQHVVADFKSKNIPVAAVVQFDMTGYRYHNEPTMWLMDDYVSKDLTAFTETLINTYVKQPVKHSRCGYACSDHASWTKDGFKSVMPFEAEMNSDNPDIHSANDTMENISLEHMTSYAKLGVAFAVELAEPVA